MIEVVPASPAHVGTLAVRMRPIDRLECSIMGHSPKSALRQSLTDATVAWTAKVDGRPEAMFGASTIGLLTGEGSPWLLVTDTGAHHAKALVAFGKQYTEEMQRIFPILKNRVHAHNSTAIRWLRHLGYRIGPVFDMNGHPMRELERRREDHV